MPFIRSLASTYCFYIVALILLLGKIMPIYFYYTKKKLVYIIIIALFSYQPFAYFKCTKLNIYLSCNVQSVSDTKYIFLASVSLFYFTHPLNRNI